MAPDLAAARTYSACRYSAFLSHAHSDNLAWDGWIENFNYELNINLQSRVGGIRVPRAFCSSREGLVAGWLDDELRDAVAASFAMILFVHDNYCESDWCLRELEFFGSLFDDEAFRKRLYIVAMSQPAMEQLQGSQRWRALFPRGEQVWMPFFQPDTPDRPFDIYFQTNRSNQKVLLTTDFKNAFYRLRDHLAERIKEAHRSETLRSSYPSTSPGAVEQPADQEVRIFIENDRSQERHSESLGQQVALTWDQIVATEEVEPPLLLRPTGLDIRDLQSRPVLDFANGVILLWASKTPESLAAQITRVEPRLLGPEPTPNLVAYLMRDPRDQPASDSIAGWPVVRFMARADGSAPVLVDDAPKLAAFLRKVLQHKRRRR